MNFALYQSIKNELNLRKENKIGKLFVNQSTEQLQQLIITYETEIIQFALSKIIKHINKLEIQKEI